MHILITDSGVGGLSVVAYAERFVCTHGWHEPVKLTFANAAPANDYGYNSMPSREMKLETFDRFLRNVTARFSPDSIYVACNTLSVLLPDTPYFQDVARVSSPGVARVSSPARVPVKGIVETGSNLLASALETNRDAVAILFGTPTTIDAGAYPRLLIGRGIDSSRIISQACPGLADIISEDREGTHTASEIRKWAGTAMENLSDANVPVIAYLACTHYGYRQDLFASAFHERGVEAKVVDPNERAVGDLFDAAGVGQFHNAEVEFVTRYEIPPATIETLTFFLSSISPRSVDALQHFIQVRELF